MKLTGYVTWCFIAIIVALGVAARLTAQEASYWPLDNNTNDLVGDRTGTLLGDATFSTNVPPLLAGHSTHSLALDGTLDKMAYEVLSGDSLNGSFTVATWVNLASARPDGWQSWFGTRSPNQAGFDFKAGPNNNRIRVDLGNGTNFPVISDTNINLGINTWHHVAVAVQPNQYDLYVDGVLVRNHTFSAFVPRLWSTDHHIAIGSIAASPDAGGEDLHGFIDDVRVFSNALTLAEIQEAMTAGRSIWSATGSGNWTTPGNWRFGNVPNDLQARVLFGGAISGPATVTVDADIMASELTFDSAIHSYTVAGDGIHSLTLVGDAALRVLAGSHTISAPVSTTQNLTKSGTGTLVLRGPVNVAGSATFNSGTALITDGATMSNVSGVLGQTTGSTGTVNVNGPGSTWSNSAELFIGFNGSGTLNITAGGQVTTGTTGLGAVIGFSSGSMGAVSVDGNGSRWNVDSRLLVGRNGFGTLNILGGAEVTTSGATIGGPSGGPVPGGAVTVHGIGSTLNAGAETIIVGDGGTATLSISGGAIVMSSAGAGVGSSSTGSRGEVTVEGAGSRLLLTSVTSELLIGRSGAGGNGAVTIRPGGEVDVTGSSYIHNGGSLNLDGGTFKTSAINFQSGGQFQWTSGTLHVGTYNGNLVNSGGRLAPGNSPGITTINGDYTQQPAGVLEIEVGGLTPGTQHDQVIVTGTAALNGRLDVPIIDGFMPQLDDEVTFLTAASVTGAFNGLVSPNLHTVNPDLALRVITTPTTAKLRFVAVSGDILFDADTTVAGWSNPSTWSTNEVPQSENIIKIQNLVGVPQQVNVAAANAFVHQLLVGDSQNTITVGVQNGRSLSATTGVVVGDNGIIELNTGSLVSSTVEFQGGMLTGNGAVRASSVVNAGGTVSPGFSVGHIDIEGDYQQTTTGTLQIELEETAPGQFQFDTVAITGRADLGGALIIDASGLTTSRPGDTFDILTADGGILAGTSFDSVQTTGKDGVFFAPTYLPGVVRMTEHFQGDMNMVNGLEEGDVAAFALALVNPREYRRRFGMWGHEACTCSGNANRLTFDDIAPFVEIMRNANVASVASLLEQALADAARVPETNTAALGILAAIGCGMIRVRKRRFAAAV